MTNESRETDLERLDDEARWEVLARFVAGESDSEEAGRVERWASGDAAREVLLRTLGEAIRTVEFAAPVDLDVDAAMRKTHARMSEPDVVPIQAGRKPVHRQVSWLRAAAIVGALMAAGLVWRLVSREPGGTGPVELAVAVYTTPMGRTDTIPLADGSRVVLAPDSRLAVVAGGPGRVVELQGQALFDVVHDASRPFTVRTASATIEDLGTTFAIREAGAEGVHVVVMSGSVRLQSVRDAESAVTLMAGDRGELSGTGEVMAERGAATEADVAWTRGRLVFDDAPFAEVRSAVRRWYGLELRADATVADRHLTATFEGESADEVLNVIRLSLGAMVERQGDTAFVRAGSSGPR